MNGILKAANVEKQAVSEDELRLINKQTLRDLTADEVFTFRMAACDNQVDRDFERFTDKALEELAPLFVGKSVLMDHKWSAANQTARIYAAAVEPRGEIKQLVLRCYIPRSDTTAATISAIETGILKECSVGCHMASAICSICGADQSKVYCEHHAGQTYDGQLCVMALDNPMDVYEVSFVAVPAQPEAGVIKSKRYGGPEEPAFDPETQRMAEAMQELETRRYGGM